MTQAADRFVVGVDVGGTHVTAAVFDAQAERILAPSRTRVDVDSSAGARVILDAWGDAIDRAIRTANVQHVGGIGFAMPGPFDYPRGICAIRGLPKFQQLFGVNVRQAIAGRMRGHSQVRVNFRNDGECFGIGEAWLGAGRGKARVVAITLGTGLGSAFICDGAPVTAGPEVPESGWLYCQPFEGEMAEEHFSSRGLLRRARGATSGKELAELAANDASLREVFIDFGRKLGEFLRPWLQRFSADRLVVGGSIAQSWDLFATALCDALGGIEARQAELFEDAALCGGARIALEATPGEVPARKSEQRLMPAVKPNVARGAYDLYPAHDIGRGKIAIGFDALAAEVARRRRVVIDGFAGVYFDDFRQRLDAALARRGVRALWYESRAALKSRAEIDKLVQPFLGGDDPLFGTRFTGSLADFFDPESLAAIKPDDAARMCILIGPGAALAGWDAPLLYLDLPKNEQQFRARAGSVCNLAADLPASPKEMYKRSYFVDWVALSDHKRSILARIDWLADAQRHDEPSFVSGSDFRDALESLSRNALRVRPWFEPGPWGGQWMREQFGDLPQDVPNYAWSFELIAPENGLLLSSGYRILEISFDVLMFAHRDRVIGESAGFFKHEFPIRFDYLDTIRGGNLSVQCHPRPRYIREQFGERFTQDETYYIHQADEDAKVYLGFNQDIDPAGFRAALEASARDGVTVDIDRFVSSFPAKKHDLFLIPNGTIHCSGVGCLVLEISATPYIFTFKMYDWMRMDLEGKPRSLNIGRAFENLNFERKGDAVQRELISQPREAASGPGWRAVHLPTHAHHFYDVMRYEFERSVMIPTNRSCHVGNLVEGSRISVKTQDVSLRVNFGETFIIPAAAEHYELVNETTGSPAMVVISFVKPDFTRAASIADLQDQAGT